RSLSSQKWTCRHGDLPDSRSPEATLNAGEEFLKLFSKRRKYGVDVHVGPIGFGPFTFDRQNRLLRNGGREIALPPRVLGVLELLIERPGDVVSRQALIDG